MMKKLFLMTLILLTLPSFTFAWQGKIVAVESADTFVVLKEGQTPTKVKLSGVRIADGIDPAKARMESSGVTLMKDVDVDELSSSNGEVIANISLQGKSLAGTLEDEGVLQSLNPVPSSSATESFQENGIPDTKAYSDISQNMIVSELDRPAQTRKQPKPYKQYTAQPKAQVRYVQVQQPQALGFWPTRRVQQVPAVYDAPVEQGSPDFQQTPSMIVQPAAQESEQQADKMKEAGDMAKQDYDLAVKVQKKGRKYTKTGFFQRKKDSETFIGASTGAQFTLRPDSISPYEDWGFMDGLTVRHFFPSGFGIGTDLTFIRNNGESGKTDGNATTAVHYDYKSKRFDTYSLTAALLYRFYTGTNFTSYVSGHAGYSIFSFPQTIFHLSDGAPTAGVGAGVLYKFDSGFTIGGDVRYLGHIGTKSDDPDGFFGTVFNIGYTFD